MNKDVAVLVTTYCGDPRRALKEHMTEKLCESLQKTTDFYICLTSHSPINTQTQVFCDASLYDADNSFKINGLPNCDNSFWIAELTSIHNGVNYLVSKGFKSFVKITYDCDPTVDFNYLIYSCLDTKKQLVSVKFQNLEDAIGTFLFYSDINFFKRVLPLEECHNYDCYTEWCLYNSLRQKTLLKEVHLENGYDDFFGLNIEQYSFCGGTEFYKKYPY